MAENTAVAKTEEKTEVAHSNNKVTDYSLGIFGTSDNFIMAMQMAKSWQVQLSFRQHSRRTMQTV